MNYEAREFIDQVNSILERDSIPEFIAHYTSYENALNILRSRQIWLSNPMLSNDHQELVPRLDAALGVVSDNPKLQNALSKIPDAYQGFVEALRFCRQHFLTDHVASTYIFCLSEFLEQRGLLSMWRGYGGDGGGIALVFKTTGIKYLPESPLGIYRVLYIDEEQHRKLLWKFAEGLASYYESRLINLGQVVESAYFVFRALLINALSWKHVGFQEEREVRLICTPMTDMRSAMKSFEGVAQGSNGLVPMLFLPINPVPGVLSEDVTLENLLTKVVLGPATSSVLAVESFRRLLVVQHLSSFADRVVACDIAYRKMR